LNRSGKSRRQNASSHSAQVVSRKGRLSINIRIPGRSTSGQCEHRTQSSSLTQVIDHLHERGEGTSQKKKARRSGPLLSLRDRHHDDEGAEHDQRDADKVDHRHC
jgi:hypothetical protein